MSTAAQYSPEYLSEYSGYKLIIISALSIALGTIFVALRYYARTLTTSAMGWDDIILPVAWLANTGLSILGIFLVHDAAVGHHEAAVWSGNDSKSAVYWAKSLYALEWLYLTSVALPKISILCLYLRIFTSRAARFTCYALIGIIAANWAAFILASTFACSPPAFQFETTVAGGPSCNSVEALTRASSAPNIATDVVMLVLPVSTVHQLHASYIRKLGLMVVFLTGSVGLIASCARMATFFKADAFVDLTWNAVWLVGWSIVEPGMYLIAACLLTLRPIFAQLSQRWPRVRLNRQSFRKSHSSISRSGGSEGLSLQHLPSGPSRDVFADMYRTEDDGSSLGEDSVLHKSSDRKSQATMYDVEQGLVVSLHPQDNTLKSGARGVVSNAEG